MPFIHSPFQGHSLVAESQILSPDGDLLEERLIKYCSIDIDLQTSQELRMLSRSLSDFGSLLLNVMIQVSQFVTSVIKSQIH